MPRTCTVCRLPDRDSVDTALVDGKLALRDVAKLHSVSLSALQRHKTQHIPKTLSRAVETTETTRGTSLLAQVRELQARAETILDKAEHGGDLRTAITAMRELRSVLDLLGRVAARSGNMVEMGIVEAYVAKVVDVLHEFVPDDRTEVAVARLIDILEHEVRGISSARVSGPSSALE
jgi:hypothetical protein